MGKRFLLIMTCFTCLNAYGQRVDLQNEIDSSSFYLGYNMGVSYFRQGVRSVNETVFVMYMSHELNEMMSDSVLQVVVRKTDDALAQLSSKGVADDSLSGWMGSLMGRELLTMGLVENNPTQLVAGMAAALRADDCGDPVAMKMYVTEFMQRSFVRRGEENRRLGVAFLAENRQKSTVKTFPAGVQYEILKEGSGIRPRIIDQVKVHYIGWHLDGCEFENTYIANQPEEFKLNQVIFGWTDALMQMSVGSRWKIYIPSDRAYGTRGNLKIGPDEVLIFEIELLEIVK